MPSLTTDSVLNTYINLFFKQRFFLLTPAGISHQSNHRIVRIRCQLARKSKLLLNTVQQQRVLANNAARTDDTFRVTSISQKLFRCLQIFFRHGMIGLIQKISHSKIISADSTDTPACILKKGKINTQSTGRTCQRCLEGFRLTIIFYSSVVSSSTSEISMPSSSNCTGSTMSGALVIRSDASFTFGNAITSRILSAPVISIIRRSKP